MNDLEQFVKLLECAKMAKDRLPFILEFAEFVSRLDELEFKFFKLEVESLIEKRKKELELKELKEKLKSLSPEELDELKRFVEGLGHNPM